MTFFEWVISFVALIGTMLNRKLYRAGFYFWLCSNFGFALITFNAEKYGMMFFFIANFIACIDGLRQWKRNLFVDNFPKIK